MRRETSLNFSAASGWSLDAEIDGAEVRGQLLDFEGDMESVEVTVETTDGQTWTTAHDESGFITGSTLTANGGQYLA